jgi:hypothetical protein
MGEYESEQALPPPQQFQAQKLQRGYLRPTSVSRGMTLRPLIQRDRGTGVSSAYVPRSTRRGCLQPHATRATLRLRLESCLGTDPLGNRGHLIFWYGASRPPNIDPRPPISPRVPLRTWLRGLIADTKPISSLRTAD